MTAPGILLDYQGPVDFPVIDALLLTLKNTKEFEDLQTTIRKRTYSLIVECIENIHNHSALKESDEKNVQPHILVRNEENEIIICASNAVTDEKRDHLVHKLESVNNMSVDELKKLHEIRIDHKCVIKNNGAGLGFICMAFKSENKLLYSFSPLLSGYLYFELQITLNK